MSNQETGYGFGVSEPNNKSNNNNNAGVTTTPSGGTYTDAQGNPITAQQAAAQGTTDSPGVSQFERIQSLGGSGAAPQPAPQQHPGIIQERGNVPGTPTSFLSGDRFAEMKPTTQEQATARPAPGRVYVPGIGWMVPRETVEAAKEARINKPMSEEKPIFFIPSLKISREPTLTGGIEKAGQDLAQGINDRTEGKNQILTSAGHIAANVITGLAIIPSALEVTGRTLITEPGTIPALTLHGAVKLGEETNEALQKNPIETIASLYIGGKVFEAAGKGAGALKTRRIESTPAAPAARQSEPLVIKPGQMGPGSPGWGSLDMPTRGTIQTPKTLTILPGIKSPTTHAPLVAAAAPAVVYQGASVEAGRTSQPLIGVTGGEVTNALSLKIGDKTFVVGTPKFTDASIKEIYGGGEGSQFGRFGSKGGIEYFKNPTEQKITMDNVARNYDPATQELLTQTLQKRSLTYGTPATHKLNDVPLEEVLIQEHGLKPETAQNVRDYMQGQKDLIIWGSTANKALVMDEGGIGYFRKIGDIDLHVTNPAKTSQDLYTIISKTEAPGTVSTKGAAGLSTEKGTLFDIKNIEGGAPEGTAIEGSSPGTGDIFGFKREPTDRIGKFQTVSLSEQTTSKLSSVALREDTISAHAGRAGKDPFDLAFINEPAQTLGLERSWNPYNRYVKAPKARALDESIQAKTIEKVRSQPEGSGPGQITPEQKAVFFENVENLRSGREVTAAPEKTLLYSPAAPTIETGITGARESAYITASEIAAQNPGRISQVVPPHSPVNVRTDQGLQGARELAQDITNRYNRGADPSQAARTKGADIFNPRGEKIINIEYFNRGKVESTPVKKFEDKSFGSQQLTGSPENAISANYYGSLNRSPSLSGGDAGTYTPQNPYYDVPGTYPGSPGYGRPRSPGIGSPEYPGYDNPKRPKSPGSPGRGTPANPLNWNYSNERILKLPDERGRKKAKITGKIQVKHTQHLNPIARASTDISKVSANLNKLSKNLTLNIAGKKRRRRL